MQYINTIEIDASFPPPPNVLIFIAQFNGLGDLLFGTKLSEAIKANLPKANVVIATDRNSIQTLQTIAKLEIEGVKFLDLDVLSRANTELTENRRQSPNLDMLWNNYKIDVENKKLKTNIIIEGPVFQNLQLYGKQFDQDIPVILVPEYNDASFKAEQSTQNIKFNNITVVESGIPQPLEKRGILIDKELAAFANADESEKKMLHMEALNILQQHLGNFSGNENAEDYLNKTEFSFCYHPKQMPHYGATAIAVAASQHNKKRNVDFFTGGDFSSVERTLNNPEVIDKIKNNGFTHIEFVNLNSQESETWLGKDSQVDEKDKKTFRILYRDKFNHDDVKQFFKLSTIVGVTGDQSISEALSCNVIPIYSALPHKRKLCLNLKEYFNSIDLESNSPKIGDIFMQLSTAEYNQSLSYDKIESLGRLLGTDAIQARFIECHQTIRKNCELNKLICETVSERLNSTPLLAAQNTMENVEESSSLFKSNTTFFPTPIQEQPITPDVLNAALTYLSNKDILSLAKMFSINNIDDTYHLIENIKPVDASKLLNANMKFKITIESDYSDRPSYNITLSKDQIISYANKVEPKLNLAEGERKLEK